MKFRTGKMDIVVNTSMTPPHWAMLERQLINAQAEATVEFCNKYFDENTPWKLIKENGSDIYFGFQVITDTMYANITGPI